MGVPPVDYDFILKYDTYVIVKQYPVIFQLNPFFRRIEAFIENAKEGYGCYLLNLISDRIHK